MRLFRRKPKQKVGGKDVTIDEKLAAAVKQAILETQPKPRRRRRWIYDAREELRKVMDEEAKKK